MKKKCKVNVRELIASIFYWAWLISYPVWLYFLVQWIRDVYPWWYFAITIGISFFCKVVLDYIKKINYQKSFIVCLLKSFIRFCEPLSIHYYLKLICNKLYKGEQEPDWISELYVLFFVFFITIGLFWMKDYWIWNVIISVAIYRLFDIMVKVGEIIFIDSELIPNNNGSSIFLPTRDPERWVILNLINIYEIVVCFAVLYFHWGEDFSKIIDDPIMAVYQSILTLTTLGYGDIKPTCSQSQLIVIFQLAYFIIFILLVAPRIFSLIRTKK